MNLDNYEKIDGREALKRLASGERIFDDSNHRYLLNWMNFVVRRESGAYETVNDGLKQILEKTWYIPKPFDVRQAMFDRPNEWVAAWKSPIGEWRKLGLNYQFLEVVETKLSLDLPVDIAYCGVGRPTAEQLENCIPIEDVPEEVTR